MEVRNENLQSSPVIISTPYKEDGPTLEDIMADEVIENEPMTTVKLSTDLDELSPIPLTPTRSSPMLKQKESLDAAANIQRSASTSSLPDPRKKASIRQFGLNLSPSLSEEGRVNEVDIEIRRRKAEKSCKIISILSVVVITLMISVL